MANQFGWMRPSFQTRSEALENLAKMGGFLHDYQARPSTSVGKVISSVFERCNRGTLLGLHNGVSASRRERICSVTVSNTFEIATVTKIRRQLLGLYG